MLGLYLGDGHIIDLARTQRLRLFLDSRYPVIGCVFVNRTGRYEYLSYEFANRSADILDLFGMVARALGLRPRRYARAIRLYRRDDVQALVENAGVKA